MSTMMRMIASGLIAGMLFAGNVKVEAAEVTVGADIASAYVFRGITFNDGPVFQPYIDVSGLPGIFEGLAFGVWGNVDIDDYDGELESGQFSEIDIWASYTLPIEAVGISIIYTEFTYPGFGGAVLGEEDGETTAEATQGKADREIGVTFELDVIGSPYFGAFYGLDGGLKKDLYLEAGVGHEFELSDELTLGIGALVGYLYPDEGDSGFHQYELSASLAYRFLTASVTYVGQIDDDVLTDDDYDVEVIGMLGLSYTF